MTPLNPIVFLLFLSAFLSLNLILGKEYKRIARSLISYSVLTFLQGILVYFVMNNQIAGAKNSLLEYLYYLILFSIIPSHYYATRSLFIPLFRPINSIKEHLPHAVIPILSCLLLLINNSGLIIANWVFVLLSTISVVIYSILSIIGIKNSSQIFFSQYHLKNLPVLYLISFILFNLILAALFPFVNINDFLLLISYVYLIFSIIIWLSFIIIVRSKKKKINSLTDLNSLDKPSDLKSDKKSVVLSEEKIRSIISEIDLIFKKDKPYLKIGYSIADLEKSIKINRVYISKAINHYDISFTDLVNKHRINESEAILADSKSTIITIEGVAQLVGYRSKSTFNSHFKKNTGVTPQEYRKKHALLKHK